jgi:PKD repeat protein
MINVKMLSFFLWAFTFSLAVSAGTKEFSVDKTEGYAPALITFNASGIKQAKKFIWNFGNGESYTTTNTMLTYQYKKAGTFTASLSYQVNASDKNPNYKDGGSVVIKVIDATPKPNQAPVAALSCSVNNLLVNCSGLSSYDPENQPLIFQFDFADGFTETNTTGLSSHAYASAGLYNVRLSVFDSAGGSGLASMQVQAVKPPNQLPVLALNCLSDLINTLNCNASGSTDSDGNIVSYSYAWDDSATETKADSTSVTHVFSNSGTHSVTLTAVDNDGGVSSLTKSFSVKANTNPIAAFNCDNSKPLKLSCSSTSTDSDAGDAIQSYSWKFGSNSAFITTTNSTDYSFSAGADVAVTLLVTDSYGGTNSLTKTFTVKDNQLPTYDFNADVISGFAPLKVHFQILNAVDPDGTITSYNLNFGDETNSGSSDVVHTFNTPGTYNVIATVTDDNGGTTTKTKQVVVNALINNPPQAFFKIFEYDTEVGLHATVTKTQYDIKRAYYTIDGGDTVEMSEFYPNTINWVDLKNFGQHEITLTVEDIYGQKSSFTHNFELADNLDGLKPFTDFTAKQSAVRTVFINLNRSFDFDIDQTIQSFHVDFGNGESVDTTDLYVTHTYPNSGTYPITVTATTDHRTSNSRTREITLTDDVTPILQPVANYGYRIFDFAQNVSFYNDRSGTPNGSIISYVWNFGDGTTGSGSRISHFYNPGSYLVTLTVVDSAGLQSTQTQHVTIFGTGPNLIAQIGCDINEHYVDITQSCQIFALDKLNQISRVRVAWGDGTANNLTLPSPNGIFKPLHKYSAMGNFPVTLTVTTTRGEIKSASTSLNLITYQPPFVAFSCNTILMKVNCSAVGSFDPNNLELSYFIEWGDGTSELSTSQNLSHTYSAPGNYQVKLTTKNSAGLINLKTQNISISNIKIIASLYCSTNNLLVSCNTLGTMDSSGSALTYFFDYGDSYIETNATGVSTHAFSSAGLHIVNLKVTNANGDLAVAQTQVQTVTPPNILPNPSLYCYSSAPYILKCNATSSQDSDGAILTYRFDWNDGTSETSADGNETFHIFQNGGSHIVTLTVTDNDGGVNNASSSFDVMINHSPFASLTCNTPGPQKIHCTSNSYDQDLGDLITEYKWDLGDGTVITSLIPSVDFFYTASSTYTVSLQVKDTMGASASATIDVTTIENQAPVASMDCFANGLQTISCQSFSYDADGSIVSTHWQLDDGFVTDQTFFSHTFESGKTHNVILTLKDDLGKTTITNQSFQLLVNQLPTFKISADNTSGNLPLSTHFKALDAIDIDGSIVSYKWNFDDGATSDQMEVDHTFTSAGIYNVKLQVTDNDGGITEKSLFVNASDPSSVVIVSDKDNGIANLVVSLDGSQSSDADGEIVKYEWFVQGGKIGEGSRIEYDFDQVGVQQIELAVTNNYGITTTANKSLVIEQPPVYLQGNPPHEAFSGSPYEVTFIPKLQDSILKDNISISLEDAPLGVTYNNSNNQLNWVPTPDQAGDHEFKVKITDGVLFSERIVRVHVYIPREVASFNNIAGGESFLISNQDSVLNNSLITLPIENSRYSIKIIEAGDSSNPIVHFEPSIAMDNTLAVHLPEEMEVEGYESSYGSSKTVGVQYSKNFYVKRTAQDLSVCAKSNKSIKKSGDFSSKQWIKYVDKYLGKINVKINKEKLSAEEVIRVKKFLDDKSILDKLERGVDINNIYFTTSDDEFESGSVYFSMPDSIFIYPKSNLNQATQGLKYTLYHESYHVIQDTVTPCREKINTAKSTVALLGILEGSADFYGIGKLDDTTKNQVDSMEGKLLTDREFAVLYEYREPYLKEYFNKYFEKGIFQPDIEYEARILFDQLEGNIDTYELLKYLSNHLDNYSENDANLGKKLLLDYSKFTGYKLDDSLLALINTFTYKTSFSNSSSSVINPIFHRTNLFDWGVDQSILNGESAIEKDFTIKMPSFSGKALVLNFPFDNQQGTLLTTNYAISVEATNQVAKKLTSLVLIPPQDFSLEIIEGFKLVGGKQTYQPRNNILGLNLFNVNPSSTETVRVKITPLCQTYPPSQNATKINCNGKCNINQQYTVWYCAQDKCFGVGLNAVDDDSTLGGYVSPYWGKAGEPPVTYDKRVICQENLVDGSKALMDFQLIQ